jgi:hypothetical protein
MNANGLPDFTMTEVQVTHDEYENGVHYDMADARLAEAGFEEPTVHFDDFDAPDFLLPAVRRYLNIGANAAPLEDPSRKERTRCHASSR